jgi:hypothetical protein
MKKIILDRIAYRQTYTIGKLYVCDTEKNEPYRYMCDTLEDTYQGRWNESVRKDCNSLRVCTKV